MPVADIEEVIEAAYTETLALLHGKEHSDARREFGDIIAKVEELGKAGSPPPHEVRFGVKRIQGFFLDGLTDQGVTFTDPAAVHAKLITHFTEWYAAPEGPWAVPISAPDSHWTQLDASWKDFKHSLADKQISEGPLRRIHEALASTKVKKGSCLAAPKCSAIEEFKQAIREEKGLCPRYERLELQYAQSHSGQCAGTG